MASKLKPLPASPAQTDRLLAGRGYFASHRSAEESPG